MPICGTFLQRSTTIRFFLIILFRVFSLFYACLGNFCLPLFHWTFLFFVWFPFRTKKDIATFFYSKGKLSTQFVLLFRNTCSMSRSWIVPLNPPAKPARLDASTLWVLITLLQRKFCKNMLPKFFSTIRLK